MVNEAFTRIVKNIKAETDTTWNFRRSNFCKDHSDKTGVPDPLVVEDLISDKLNNRRKLARLITQYGDIFSNISKGTAFLLQRSL